MARCCGDNCLCRLVEDDDFGGNDSLSITGTGTAQDPFLIGFRGLRVNDSASVNLTLTYDTAGYALTGAFATTSRLTQLGDVDALSPLNGQVLAWADATGQWVATSGPFAEPGAVLTDTSLAGDGSGAAPLAVAFDPAGALADNGSGITLNDEVVNMLVRRFTDEVDRDAALVAPVLNSLSMLDNYPGVVWYFDGADWQTLVHVVATLGTEYVQFSGEYLNNPLTVLVLQMSAVTDDTGAFLIWSQDDLAGFNGVLALHVQPTGDTPWFCVLPGTPDLDVYGYAYVPTSSVPQPDFAVTGIVTAFLY